MGFVANNKLQEIRQAARNGNEKAQKILQALRKQSAQSDIDNLVNDYYYVPPIQNDEPIVDNTPLDDKVEEINDNNNVEENNIDIEQIVAEENEEEELPQNNVVEDENNNSQVEDIYAFLDKDMDGLISENEVEDYSFSDFLKNKSSDANRLKKDASYFKAYDSNGRQKYLEDKIKKYQEKFDGNKKDINRKHNDFSKSLINYSQNVNEMLDDSIELDMDKVSGAYQDFTNNGKVMSSFGRHWDEEDSNFVKGALEYLVSLYGKKNVTAMLNNLSADNDAYRDYRNNQIDTEINRYTKDIEKLLK